VFQALKKAMPQTPILALPNFSNSFILATNACEIRVGDVLVQGDRPLAFQTLALKHLGLNIYDKELIIILMVVDKWRYYLEGN